jgi:hypothetical protein
MNRRGFLAVCGSATGVLAGCLGGARDAAGLPDECPTSPDTGDRPERPAELTRDSVAEFLADYEYALAPARDPTHASPNYIEHVRTEQVDGGYRVHLFVEPKTESTPPGSSPETTEPDATTTYTVAYFIDEHRIRRQTLVGPTSYTGLHPGENGTLVAC